MVKNANDLFCQQTATLIKYRNSYPLQKPPSEAGHQWLMPEILAMLEAEIWRIHVPGQPRQKVQEFPSQPIADA
jgi:hypothetical protein